MKPQRIIPAEVILPSRKKEKASSRVQNSTKSAALLASALLALAANAKADIDIQNKVNIDENKKSLYSEFADKYNIKINTSGNLYTGLSGAYIPAAGLGLNGRKGDFSAYASTYYGVQFNPRKYPFSFTLTGVDYLYPEQDNNSVKLSSGACLSYLDLGSSYSGYVGLIPAKLICELPKDFNLAVSPVIKHYYQGNDHENRLDINTTLSRPITKDLSWYMGYWLYNSTRHPGKRDNNEIDTGFIYNF